MKRGINIFLILICLSAAAFAEKSSVDTDKASRRPAKYGRYDGWGMSSGIFVIMSRLKENNPQEYARLNELRKRDFRTFIKEIRRLMPKCTDFKRIGELKRQEAELADKIVKLENEKERKALELELKSKLKEDFDIMVREAEARIEMMRQYLETIKENEPQFLQERFDMMLNKAEARKTENGLPPPPPHVIKK